MSEFFKSRMARSLLPYLLLAIGVIIAWNVIGEFGTFVSWVERAWAIVTPFFYGFILAYILNMPCSAFSKLFGKSGVKFVKKRQRGFSVVTTYLLFIALLVVILWLLIPRIVDSAALFVTELPNYNQNVLEFLDDFTALEFLGIFIYWQPEYAYVDGVRYALEQLPEGVDFVLETLPEGAFHLSEDTIMEFLQGFTQEMVARFDFNNVWGVIAALFGNVFSAVFTTFLAFVSSIFFLIEKEQFSRFATRMLGAFTSRGTYNVVLKYIRKLNFNFRQYIYTQTIDGIILGTIVTLELAFIIRSPFALVLGLMLGVVNYIPYFGSIFGSAIAVVVVAFTQGMGMGALAAVILLITQQIDGNVIQPKLMGSSFKLSPLLIIVSVTVGGAFAGILGMLAAIPIVAVLKDILDNIIIYFEQKKSNKIEEVSD